MNPVSDFTFTQLPSRHELIPSSWVLLDSQSTVSGFKNPNFLTNIRRSNSQLKVHTNDGTQISSLVGDIKNFGTVWYNPNSLANIFSLAAVRKLCRITMDTSIEAALCVHCSDGSFMKFIEYGLGLYYHDAAAAVQPNSNENVIDCSFVSTVANNKAQFPRREIEGADKARALYRKIERPSQQQFEQILAKNLIRNCPVTVDDAKRALLIYGPDVAALKGKTTKGPSQHVPTFNPVQVPAFILQHHSDVTLCMDIFYVQGHPFFHTISRKVQFRTVAPVLNRNKATLLREIKPVMAMHKSRGFNIFDLHANMEFECIRNDVLPSRLNVTAADDHVGEVEQSIRTMKERARTTIHGLPFKRLPKVMIQALVYHAAKGLNQFPAKNGISDTLSPLTIMTGRANPDYDELKLQFGSYVQVFQDNTPSNTTSSRNTGVIVLNPTGNAQGDYFFNVTRHWKTLVPAPMDRKSHDQCSHLCSRSHGGEGRPTTDQRRSPTFRMATERVCRGFFGRRC